VFRRVTGSYAAILCGCSTGESVGNSVALVLTPRAI
jgi:hypothetical protein